ncbi:MFS transporter [Bacillus cereus]|uniref:MFS transporter n=1 Tax=Bacillus cereus group TaxID=86661 RepID=UPI0015596512|nr:MULTISPECIES: MFS transporter [Bacillus cereus group]MEC3196188.1 MFS transporter [Bacillus cereus]WJX08149.1 MFS transporter [Bacillus cereus]
MNLVIKKLWPIYLAYLISQFGNWAFRAGFVYALYDQQNGSNTVLGWTIVLVYVPILLGGRLLSPLADRFNSRKLLIGIDMSRIVLLAPLLFWSDFNNSIDVIIGLAAITLLSLFTPVFASAQSVYIRRTVDKEHITAALAVVSNIDWFSTLVGTICGPILLMYFDFQKITILDLITFVVSIIIFILLLNNEKAEIGSSNSEKIADESSVFEKKSLFLPIASIFFLNLGAGVINLYPNIIARNIYGVGEIGLSYIYLANGLGGLLGAILIQRLRKKFQLINIVFTASILIGFSLIGMSLLSNFVVSIICSSLMLLFGQLFGVGIHSYLLTNNSVEHAGRITGLFMYATFSGVALNAILFATMISDANLGIMYGFLIFCAIVAFVSTILLLNYLYKLKKESKVTSEIQEQSL